jgi:hypothetical protein
MRRESNIYRENELSHISEDFTDRVLVVMAVRRMRIEYRTSRGCSKRRQGFGHFRESRMVNGQWAEEYGI